MAVTQIQVRNYDLDATLASGQAFGWSRRGDRWVGSIRDRWVELASTPEGIQARTPSPIGDGSWLRHYLQADVDLKPILESFPDDPSMRASVSACLGLRLLRQDPWECLASFILSSTKQIVQIQQICGHLRQSLGAPLAVPEGDAPMNAFPTAAAIAGSTETALRACKMGFRAPSLLLAARAVDSGTLDLAALQKNSLEEAREQLCTLRGVGPKIANCVLLFAYDFPTAFPVDVWVYRALRELYFPKRRPRPERLERFSKSYFGPHAGYAQQYLFHYIRQREGRVAAAKHPSAEVHTPSL